MFEEPTNAPMELSEYFGIFRRRLWVIIVVTLLVVGAALAYSLTRENTYTAVGRVVLGRTLDGREPDVTTQAQVMQSQAVHLLADATQPGAPFVTAEQDGDSGGITVEASSQNRETAAKSVNTHVAAYLQYLRERAQFRYDSVSADFAPDMAALQQQIDALDAQVLAGVPSSAVSNQRNGLANRLGELQDQLEAMRLDIALAGQNVDIVERATPPAAASSPQSEQTGLVALGAGLLLGVLLALLLEFMDDTIRTRQDLLRVAGGAVPTLGVIPATRSRAREIVSLTRPDSPAAEAYRSLRTAMNFASDASERCVEVTSPRTRHGKTETLVNLAVLAAQAGQRVVVVDCDLRAPRLHDYFGLPNDIGFTSVVYGEPMNQALQRVPGVDRLFVLTSGPLPLHPSEVLASERSHEVLTSLQTDNTLVLVDTPPLLVVTDAAALAPSTGAVLLVAAAGVARRKQLRQALDRLRQIDAGLLGMVLYRADSGDTGGFGEDVGRRERREAARQRSTMRDLPARTEVPARATDTA